VCLFLHEASSFLRCFIRMMGYPKDTNRDGVEGLEAEFLEFLMTNDGNPKDTNRDGVEGLEAEFLEFLMT